MMSIWRRFFFIKLLLILGCIYFFAYFLLATQTGSTVTLNFISLFSQKAFDFSSIEGTLANKFSINNFTYRSDTLHLSARHLTIAWQPLQLLKKTIAIDTLTGNDIKINFPISTQHKKSTLTKKNLFELPAYIKLTQSELKNIVIIYPDQPPLEIQKITSTLILNKNILINIVIHTALPEISTIILNAT